MRACLLASVTENFKKQVRTAGSQLQGSGVTQVRLVEQSVAGSD